MRRAPRLAIAVSSGLLTIAIASPPTPAAIRGIPRVRVLTKEAKVERGRTVGVRIGCLPSSAANCLGNLSIVSMRRSRFFEEGVPLTEVRRFELAPGREQVLRLHGETWAEPKRGQRRRGYAFVKAKAILVSGRDDVHPVKIHFKRRRR